MYLVQSSTPFSRILILLAFCSFGFSQLFAQVDVFIQVLPPYPVQLEAYTEDLTNMVFTVVPNPAPLEDTVRLYFVIQVRGPKGITATTTTFDPTEPTWVVVPNMGMSMITGMDIENMEWEQEEDISYGGLSDAQINKIQVNRVLPEGDYEVCLIAFDFDQPGREISNECDNFSITFPERPIIFQPADQEQLIGVGPPQVNISWFPIVSPDPEVLINTRYTLKIVDMEDSDLFNPTEAMQDPGTPVIIEEDDIAFTSYLLQDIELIDSHQYAVRVTAYDIENQIAYQFGGHSEVTTFTYLEANATFGEREGGPIPDTSTLVGPSISPLRINWETTDGGSGVEIIHDMVETRAGYLVTVGETSSGSTGQKDGYLLILDPHSGEELYKKQYGGAGKDIMKSVVELPNGDLMIAGYSNSKSLSKMDGWLIKTDAKGNRIWEEFYGTAGKDEFHEMVVSPSDASVVISGYKNDQKDGDIWLLKLREKDIRWEKQLGKGYLSEVQGLLPNEEGYALMGTLKGQRQVWLIETDQEGNILGSIKRYGKDQEVLEAKDFIRTQSGGYAIAGAKKNQPQGDTDMWLMKLDKEGNTVWENTYGGSGDDQATGLVQTMDGGFVLIGGTKSHDPGTSFSSLHLLSTNTDGEVRQSGTRTYGGNEEDYGSAIIQLRNSDLAVAGVTNSKESNNTQAWLINFDNETDMQRFLRQNAPDLRFADQVSFIDKSNRPDGVLDPEETGYLDWEVINTGGSDIPLGCLILEEQEMITGFSYQLDREELDAMSILPGVNNLRIPFTASKDLQSGRSKFRLTFRLSCRDWESQKLSFNCSGKAPIANANQAPQYSIKRTDALADQGNDLVTDQDTVRISMRITGNQALSEQDLNLRIEPASCQCLPRKFSRELVNGQYQHDLSFTIPTKEGKKTIDLRIFDKRGNVIAQSDLVVRRKSSLHLAAIAPSYPDLPQLNQQARDFTAALESDHLQSTLFDQVISINPMDDQAIKTSDVRATFKQIKDRFENFDKPQPIIDRDIVIVYMAVKGKKVGNRLHLVLPDGESLDYENLFVEYLQSLNCRRMLFLDIHPMPGQTGLEELIADINSRQKQMTILSLCQSNNTNLADNYLAPSILKAFTDRSTQKADANGDDHVSVRELFAYIKRKLPEQEADGLQVFPGSIADLTAANDGSLDLYLFK
ncbi:MAG: hypothetical protein AAFP19_05645 [Bacteroidota bacterium]